MAKLRSRFKVSLVVLDKNTFCQFTQNNLFRKDRMTCQKDRFS